MVSAQGRMAEAFSFSLRFPYIDGIGIGPAAVSGEALPAYVGVHDLEFHLGGPLQNLVVGGTKLFDRLAVGDDADQLQTHAVNALVADLDLTSLALPGVSPMMASPQLSWMKGASEAKK